MNETECPGLPASWINAWLAAIGLLVLEPRLRLRWTMDASPIAVFSAENTADVQTLISEAWPCEKRLNLMPIAQKIKGLPNMERQVPLTVFQQRADFSRGHIDSWTLSSTVTDLCVDTGSDTVRHAPLDAKGPGTTKWLHHRLLKSYNMVESPSESIRATLKGRGRRVINNGLGFDFTRISGLANSTDKVVDPVIEVLAFFGLHILPMRGKGRDIGKSGTKDRFVARQRCWILDGDRITPRLRLNWPAWRQPLNLPGVDALLDLWSDLIARSPRARETGAILKLLGIHAGWQTRDYIQRGNNDPTVGFISTAMKLDAR